MTNFLPSGLIHLLEKFQKTVLLCESAAWIPASPAIFLIASEAATVAPGRVLVVVVGPGHAPVVVVRCKVPQRAHVPRDPRDVRARRVRCAAEGGIHDRRKS